MRSFSDPETVYSLPKSGVPPTIDGFGIYEETGAVECGLCDGVAGHVYEIEHEPTVKDVLVDGAIRDDSSTDHVLVEAAGEPLVVLENCPQRDVQGDVADRERHPTQ